MNFYNVQASQCLLSETLAESIIKDENGSHWEGLSYYTNCISYENDDKLQVYVFV